MIPPRDSRQFDPIARLDDDRIHFRRWADRFSPSVGVLSEMNPAKSSRNPSQKRDVANPNARSGICRAGATGLVGSNKREST